VTRACRWVALAEGLGSRSTGAARAIGSGKAGDTATWGGGLGRA
jgi:hypothetical protein